MRRPSRPVLPGGRDARGSVVELVFPTQRRIQIPRGARTRTGAREFSAPNCQAHPQIGLLPRQIDLLPGISPPKSTPTRWSLRAALLAPTRQSPTRRPPRTLVIEMSTPATARKLKRSSDAAAAAQAHTLDCSGPNSAVIAFGRGGGLAAAPRSLVRGGGPFAPPRPLGRGAAPSSAPPHSLGLGHNAFTSSAAAQMDYRGFPSSASCMDGFPFPSSSANLEADNADSSSPGSW